MKSITTVLCAVFAFNFITEVLGSQNSKYHLNSFHIDLGAGIPHLQTLLNVTKLPQAPLYPGTSPTYGVDLNDLKAWKAEWAHGYNWTAQEVLLNRFDHFTAQIEGLSIHFVHQKSHVKGAVPVLLLHGWPGSFYEFDPVIESLTEAFTDSNGSTVAFDVIVPSLPGFVFSSAPPFNWTVDDTARVFNTLMVEVLGYPTYTIHGTDWGSGVAYSLYSNFNQTVSAASFVFLPFASPTFAEIAAANVTLTATEQVTEARGTKWSTIGNGYFLEQTFKPHDIGLALYDNPVGQLAWIGEKVKLWSDPHAGHSPSVLNSTAILNLVSLYYLTGTFESSVWIYAQNPNGFRTTYTKAPTEAPLFFTQYEYNVGLWPEQWVARVGNLVSYKVADFGGHFAGLDNPPQFLADIREMGLFLKR
ncbi:unnamed protein product [Mycena citricolor]|uniref:Epoxide hydrolase N-terminal domain-containing protein n=1 Tax=Mycena citricolor TaxID=2018698 RepID=A0AAD2H051_9AGAR|nr:unnamed protein product [Mycena citricolor]